MGRLNELRQVKVPYLPAELKLNGLKWEIDLISTGCSYKTALQKHSLTVSKLLLEISESISNPRILY